MIDTDAGWAYRKWVAPIFLALVLMIGFLIPGGGVAVSLAAIATKLRRRRRLVIVGLILGVLMLLLFVGGLAGTTVVDHRQLF